MAGAAAVGAAEGAGVGAVGDARVGVAVKALEEGVEVSAAAAVLALGSDAEPMPSFLPKNSPVVYSGAFDILYMLFRFLVIDCFEVVFCLEISVLINYFWFAQKSSSNSSHAI